MVRMRRSGTSNVRRYSPREKEQAVWMVWARREELGTSQGTVKRVAGQLGCGVESVRVWVNQADVDAGVAPGLTFAGKAKAVELEPEIRELRRGYSIPRSSVTLFAAELDRPLHRGRIHRCPQEPFRDRADLKGPADRPIDALGRQGPPAVRASPTRRRAQPGAAAAVAGQIRGVWREGTVDGSPSGWPRCLS